MNDNVADNLDGKGKRYLTHINNNTEKMSRIIDDLLTFSGSQSRSFNGDSGGR
jgi:signal transduction histidine kinase